MRMTLADALLMIDKGWTPQEYETKAKSLRRYQTERYDLEDAIEVLGDDPRSEKKRKRLGKVLEHIERLEKELH